MSYTPAWQHKQDPWKPADHDEVVVFAVRAFRAGKANEGQQKLIWEYLAYLGGVGDEWQDLAFRPGPNGDRDTTFAAGKQFPVLQLRKLCRSEYTPKNKPVVAVPKPAKAKRKRK